MCIFLIENSICVVQKKDEAYFRNLLRVVESTPGLYYSYETDITVKYAAFLYSPISIIFILIIIEHTVMLRAT